MRTFFMTIVLFALAWSLGCSANKENPNKNTSQTPTPTSTPAPTKEETEIENKKTELEQMKAITDFVEKHYKGYVIQGVASIYLSAQCEIGVPCHVHLTKGTENKIVSVVLQHFYKTDGSTYWLVYEARSIDLAQARIEEIKDREKDAVLENLRWDDCEDVCQAQLEEARDAASTDERGDYDP